MPMPPSATNGEAFKPYGGAHLDKATLAAFISGFPVGMPVTTLPAGDGPVANAETPAPSVSWMAVNPSKWGSPADAQIAVSSTHVAVGFNAGLVFYTRQGTPVGCCSSRKLFSPLGFESDPTQPYPVTHYDDLRLVFDEYRKRFLLLTSCGADSQDPSLDYWKTRSLQALAMSVSEDPLEGWYLYWWDAPAHYTEETPAPGDIYERADAPDYPNLGVSPDLILATCIIKNTCQVGTTNPCTQYNPTNANKPYWHLVILKGNEISQGFAGSKVSGWHWWDITNPDGSRRLLQPAVHHGKTNATWLVSAENAKSKFAVFRLTNALTAQQDLQSTEVKLNPSYPKNAAQDAPQLNGPPGAVIDMSNLGADMLKAVFRAPYLYLTAPDSRAWGGAPSLLASIRFWRVRATDFPNISNATSAGYVDRVFGGGHPGDKPDPTMGYGWPALEVNAAHHTVIVYARSGRSIYPEVRYSAYLAADTDIRSSNRLKKGDGAADLNRKGNGIRWGDNAGACVDPSDDNGIWITQQYANKDGGYDLWVGKIFGATKVLPGGPIHFPPLHPPPARPTPAPSRRDPQSLKG